MTHLAVVPGLCISPASFGSVVILSFDISDDVVRVQASAVVHSHNNIGV